MNPPDAYFVVLVPDASQAGLLPVEAMREKYDFLHGKMPPHVTLVFPQGVYDAQWLSDIVTREFSGETGIDAVFDTLTAVHEQDGSYLFLSTSDAGILAKITAWHKKLYSHENLANTLQSVTPFKAHITVGRFKNAADADKAYDESKSSFTPVKLKMNSLCVIHRKNGERIVYSKLPLT